MKHHFRQHRNAADRHAQGADGFVFADLPEFVADVRDAGDEEPTVSAASGRAAFTVAEFVS